MQNRAQRQSGGIGEYSTSPAGQVCLWVAAIGVIGILGLSYLTAYVGVTHDPLDHVENGIVGATRPTPRIHRSASHARRRYHRHRIVYRTKE